jgi:hypothetical protein
MPDTERYWAVGRAYRDLHTKFLKGETPGLPQALHKARLDCLKMRAAVLAMLRKKLEPTESPPAK